jgi:hypothetical protein
MLGAQLANVTLLPSFLPSHPKAFFKSFPKTLKKVLDSLSIETIFHAEISYLKEIGGQIYCITKNYHFLTRYNIQPIISSRVPLHPH